MMEVVVSALMEVIVETRGSWKRVWGFELGTGGCCMGMKQTYCVSEEMRVFSKTEP